GSHHAPHMTTTFTEYEERQKAQGKKIELRNDIGRLMREVVRCANHMRVTPAMADSQPYKSFNALYAQAALFDEAAAMNRTEGPMVYGNSMRSSLAVGDEKQLLPTLLTMGETYPDGSVLVWSAALENYHFAGAMREFLNDHDGLHLLPGTMSPAFVNCKDCPCRINNTTKSKHNPRAIACMMVWLEDFVKAVNFPVDRIVAITPYCSNLWHIRAELASSTFLNDVQATTIDSYQGRENDMVVLCLAVDKSAGLQV
ncbi:helicase MAGATAMA, partial [Fusarium pseudocircinatum]